MSRLQDPMTTLEEQYRSILLFCYVYFSHLNPSHQSLQVFERLLQRLFLLKLQRWFVDLKTLLHILG